MHPLGKLLAKAGPGSWGKRFAILLEPGISASGASIYPICWRRLDRQEIPACKWSQTQLFKDCGKPCRDKNIPNPRTGGKPPVLLTPSPKGTNPNLLYGLRDRSHEEIRQEKWSPVQYTNSTKRNNRLWRHRFSLGFAASSFPSFSLACSLKVNTLRQGAWVMLGKLPRTNSCWSY